jgi:outer membrane protein assembly factor BamB
MMPSEFSTVDARNREDKKNGAVRSSRDSGRAKGRLFWPGRAAVATLCLGLVTASVATVTPAPSTTNVTTYHNDNARQGQNLQETVLTRKNVKSATFGLLFNFPVDGVIDAQPLYLSGITIGGMAHNVIYAVTENDSVYAIDADTGMQLWQISVLKGGESPSGDQGCGQISPQIGITSTPVIDLTSGPHGTIYVVAMTTKSGNYNQRIHALDLTTGAEEFGGPTDIQAKYPGTGANSRNGFVIFQPKQYAERQGLLLLNHVIYLGWTSHCDSGAYTGWVMGYDESTLAQTSVLNLTPNGSEGAIWQAGAGMAATDSDIFLLDANGTFDTTLNRHGFPTNGNFGNAFVKISPQSGKLTVTDYFTMSNTVQESNNDEDFGSGGALLLPAMKDSGGMTRDLAVGAGKDGNIYIVDRMNMGKFNPNNDNAIYQEIDGALPGGDWSMPAYYHGSLYFGPEGSNLLQFKFSQAKLSTTAASQSAITFTYPGTTPSVSANGEKEGIVWAIEHASSSVLHAYNASNLADELYNSSQAGSRDQFGSASHFGTPTIASGKVYVGTTNSVASFGLLGQ